MVEKKAITFIEDIVDCPRYKAACFQIRLTACMECPYHKGIEVITKVNGRDIRDILCTLPVHRRITRLIEEGANHGS